jgi:hypothetical protein
VLQSRWPLFSALAHQQRDHGNRGRTTRHFRGDCVNEVATSQDGFRGEADLFPLAGLAGHRKTESRSMTSARERKRYKEQAERAIGE